MNKKYDYTVTFATLNCIDYTKKCLDSLIESGVDKKRIVIVDNASTDGTQNYLQETKVGATILNKENLSCGAAWNQGILAQQSEWTIVMNNDIVVTDNFAENLIHHAEKNNLKIVSPARIDGSLDYDFKSFSQKSQTLTHDAVRLGGSNAICMCIHWSVFKEIGFFRADPNLLGFEDGLFYNEIRKKKIQHATVGGVWIHHFGSVTQEHLKLVLGIQSKDVLVKHNDRKLYNQSWIQRKIHRIKHKQMFNQWRAEELSSFGMTLHGARINKEFIWL
jgi:GT2 family glycosyltransferase